MAFVAVEKDGTEVIFNALPKRYSDCWGMLINLEKETCWTDFQKTYLPTGSIKKLIGMEISWKDDPHEL